MCLLSFRTLEFHVVGSSSSQGKSSDMYTILIVMIRQFLRLIMALSSIVLRLKGAYLDQLMPGITSITNLSDRRHTNEKIVK